MDKIKNPFGGMEDQGYNCFACCPSNPFGLKMEFYEDGDEIVSIDGTRVHSARDLYYCLYRSNDGKFDITLKRDGKKIEFTELEVYYNMEEGFCSFIVGSEKVSPLNIIPGAVRETLEKYV